ncbi:MAG: sugar ABC transporter ATP-binding protein [Anaerolineae bacterium]
MPALIDAELDLRAGEVHALMGENGAGKSTLIKVLAGVVTPDRADIEIGGRSAAITSPQSAHHHGLRFIHQELQVIRQVSAAENIFLGQPYPTRWGFQVRWRQLYQQAEHVLTQLGIDHIDPRRTMGHFGPGDQMLINIAHAFVGDDLSHESQRALIYVMDEPTASLTGSETAQLFRVIERLRERGCAVLYVSHRLDEIFAIAQRVTVMRDGRVVDTSDIQTLKPADLILKMTGRDFSQIYPPRIAPPADAVLLQAQSISTRSIHEATFQVRAGEILGIAGLNGSGRTELLRALMGLDTLKSGMLTLDGVPMNRLSPSEAWRRLVAYVPEERRSQGLILSRSVADNITLPQLRHLSVGGWLLAHRRERDTARTLGESVQLKTRGPRQTVRELSGGNQQKVVFGRALVRPPRVLLLDEPTRGVDVGAKVDLYHLIREISGRGTAILLVSSDLPELLGMTDRILIMRAGHAAEIVETAGLTQERLLELCYGNVNDVVTGTIPKNAS